MIVDQHQTLFAFLFLSRLCIIIMSNLFTQVIPAVFSFFRFDNDKQKSSLHYFQQNHIRLHYAFVHPYINLSSFVVTKIRKENLQQYPYLYISSPSFRNRRICTVPEKLKQQRYISTLYSICHLFSSMYKKTASFYVYIRQLLVFVIVLSVRKILERK